MKKIILLLILVLGANFSVISQASVEEFVVFDSLTFTPTLPSTYFGDGDVIIVSDEITNNNNLNSFTAIIRYHNMTPHSGSYRVIMVVEGLLNNMWYPVGFQFQEARDTLTGVYVVNIFPLDNSNQVEDVSVSLGNHQLAKISRNVGSVPDRLRIKLLVGDTSENFPLTSIKASVIVRKFNF